MMINPDEPLQRITPERFADLAWLVLFLKGRELYPTTIRNFVGSESANWLYYDDLIWIADNASREFLTIRSKRGFLIGSKLLLSKKRSSWDSFNPEEWAIDHLEKLLVLDILAGL